LATGSDGNTILDECGLETPAGATLNFRLARPVKADFILAGNPSCGRTDIQFSHDGANNVNSWNWSFSPSMNSTQQNPQVTFSSGNYNVRLIVSNGNCSDTATQQINITGDLQAGFSIPEAICEGDTMHIQNTTQGFADSWEWDLGDGITSSVFAPPAPSYVTNGRERFVTVRLIATNISSACMDTVKKVVRVLPHCSLSVPTAFTPNGDGKNDFFSPIFALRAKDMKFRVFNRYGQVVFNSVSWNNRWDGKINGVLQDTGVYAWVFEYSDGKGRRVLEKGTVLLIR
jgi:gliding motility-associated-like protein